MAYASQMRFEVLRRALWAQQVRPKVVFDWERVAQDPKMLSAPWAHATWQLGQKSS